MKPFDLNKVLSDCIKEQEQAANTKNIVINSSIPEGVVDTIGDANEIGGHVIKNLLDNAIKYTPSGSIDISLAKKDGNALLSVKDSGIGITDEDKKNLFTEGGRGRNAIKTNVNSTGYGLYIAKQIVDAHGGRIWAESEGQGKGSTFYVELKLII
jgi:signal transduction histidine kinase